MKKYYSLREISTELGIPKSTVVKYKDYFTDFLKMSGDGKRKKFEENALEVLRAIRDLRENQRLDWLEIKDILAKQYGAPEPPPVVAVAPAAPPPPAVSPKIDYISHMVTVLGGELMDITSALHETSARALRNSNNTAVLAKRLAKVERKLDIVITELLNREGMAAEGMKQENAEMRREFNRINVAIHHLGEEMAGVKAAPAEEAEAIKQLKQLVDRLGKDGAAFQSKYQVLLRENEILKAKIKELNRTQEEKPASPPRKSGGVRSIFRRA